MNYWGVVALLGSLAACNPDKADTDAASTGGSAATESGSTTNDLPTTTGSSGDATGTGSSTAGSSTTAADTGTSDPTTGGGEIDCDPSAQDCAEGDKCTAYAKMMVDTWDANKCVPVTGDGVAGDPCTVDGGIATGIDDCAKGYICLNQKDDGTEGYCVEFCTPEMACPNTSGGAGYCLVANEGVLPICLDLCDPLTQDCPGLGACYVGDNNYICYGPDPVDTDGLEGAECNFLNACAKGLNCNEASTVDGCMTDQYGCCNPFCALDEANPCTAPEVCTAVYGEMQPPGYENVGLCALPG